MAQANRVHSTPPTNTSVTRRKILGTAAGAAAALAATGAVAAAIPTAAAAAGIAPDPAFALIAEKLAADVAHCKAIDVQGEFDERGDHSSDAAIEAQDNSEAACHLANEVDWKLARTVPTTLAGVAALLRFANEIEDEGGEWPDTDAIGRDGWHYQLRAPMRRRLRQSFVKEAWHEQCHHVRRSGPSFPQAPQADHKGRERRHRRVPTPNGAQSSRNDWRK